MKHKITTHSFGDIGLKATSDIIDGEQLDTRIEINDETLVWVAGEAKDEFILKLQKLIQKYRI